MLKRSNPQFYQESKAHESKRVNRATFLSSKRDEVEGWEGMTEAELTKLVPPKQMLRDLKHKLRFDLELEDLVTQIEKL